MGSAVKYTPFFFNFLRPPTHFGTILVYIRV